MDVMDAANYFIDAAKSEGEEGEGVSNLKLQRLLYLAQMVALREQGEALRRGFRGMGLRSGCPVRIQGVQRQ